MCCPEEADNGFLCNIKKIFTGMKRCQSACKDKVYTYSMSQLKCIEKEISILEDETYCHEGTIRDALSSDCITDSEYLRSALSSIMDKLECIRCDLQCAHECYDPVRDRCENELICQLMDRTRCLEMLVSDLLQQLCLLECQGNGWNIGNCGWRCRPGCRSPCFQRKGTCEPCIPGCEPCGPYSCGPTSCSYGGSRGPCGPFDCSPVRPPVQPCVTPGPCAYPRPVCEDRRKPNYPPRVKIGRPCNVGCVKPCCKPLYRPGRYYDRY